MIKVLLIMILVGLGTVSSAQLYRELKIGTGWGIGGTVFSETEIWGTTGAVNSNLITTYDSKTLNFGKGFNANAVFGMQLKDWISPEIGVHFNTTKNSLVNLRRDQTILGVPSEFRAESLTTTEIFTSMLSADYGIKIHKNINDNQLFMRIGIRTSLFTKYVRNYHVNSYDTYLASGDQYQWEYYHEQKKNGGISFGANLSIGYSLKVSDKAWFTIEAYSTALNWSPKHLEMLRYEVNGNDQVTTAPEDHLHSIFLAEVSGDQDQSISAGGLVADYTLKETYPWSSAGIRIGFKFGFGKKW
ncbi:MAG: hypothetical protein JKY54_09230 [Flavobacteriales bacterium]|nr:hypothetical protein [Flavobacteriales bacterium]